MPYDWRHAAIRTRSRFLVAPKSGSAAAEKAKTRNDYVSAIAGAVSRLTSSESTDVLAQLPQILVTDFGAVRSELWLWDDSSRSAYLTHASGKKARHRKDFAAEGDGPAGKIATGKKHAENLLLASFGDDYSEFAHQSGLTHVAAYPLHGKDKLLGVLVNYTAGAVDDEMLKWWNAYAEIASIASLEVLSSEQSRKTITQLSLLFEATRLLNSTLDLAELLDLILKIARTEVKADRGTVFLVDYKHKELWSIVAHGLDHREIRVPFGRGVAGKVAETGQSVNVEDAYQLPFFDSSFDRKFNYTTRSLLCLPIRHHDGQIVGVIQLLNKIELSKFTAEDEDFLVKLSGHMAMALENARLHREIVEKQRLEKEMALARQIQRSLLPDAPPIVPGYDIGVTNEPCFEVGGDYYDFLHLGPHTMLLVIADVEGKGVSSALVMSNLQATLRALVMHLHSLEVLALSLNEMIYNDTKSEKYLSCFLGLVDTRRGGLHYINAGHVPPLLLRGDGGEYQLLEDGGTVIGLFPKSEYSRGSVNLEPGDVLVCCTDGIYEAMNPAEEEYGTPRLAACVARNRSKPAQAIVEAVLEEVAEFSKGGTHVDDKVLMIVKANMDGTMSQAARERK
jgi:phosphoserine phosphatase RsbU/P